MHTRKDLEQLLLAYAFKDDQYLTILQETIQPKQLKFPVFRKVYKAILACKEENVKVELANIYSRLQENLKLKELTDILCIPLVTTFTDVLSSFKEILLRENLEIKFNNALYLLKKGNKSNKNKILEDILEIQEDILNSNITQKWERPTKEARTDKNFKIIDFLPLEIKVQLGTIWGLAGATSAGKTELAIDISKNFAKMHKDNVVLYAQYEGTKRDFCIRLLKKNIDKLENYYYILKPDFIDYLEFIEANKNKNILIVLDYLQMFARRLISKSNIDNKIRFYVNKIFNFFDNLRLKYNNVSICFILSLSKAGITDIRQGGDIRLAALNAIKESGDVQYDLDYCYSVFFTDDFKQSFLSRKNPNTGENRKYLWLAVAKQNRVGAHTKDVCLEYREGKYKNISRAPF